MLNKYLSFNIISWLLSVIEISVLVSELRDYANERVMFKRVFQAVLHESRHLYKTLHLF